MNTPSCTLLRLAAFAAASVAVSLKPMFAQTLTKANNTTNLTLAGSWVENTVPTTSNVLVFSNTWTTGSVAMGGNLSVAGLQITNVATGNGRITFTGTQSLTLGSNGIDMSAATGNFRIDPAIVLGANQTWSVASGRILNLVANGVTSPGGYKATVTGSGTLAFDASGSGTYGSEVEIDLSVLRVNFATTNVTITNANNSFGSLTLFNGRGNFSSIGNIGVDSAAGTGSTTAIQLGGNNTNGIFGYTGSTASTNRSFSMDKRATASGIEVTTAGQTLTITGTLNSTLGNNSTANNGWLLGGEGNLHIAGVISAKVDSNNTTTNLTKTGSGTLTLSAANTYTGLTTISGGTLQLGNGGTTGTLATTSSIVNNGVFAINRSNTVAQGTDFSGSAITGTGGLSQLGSGTTTLSAANTYTGATTIAAGTLGLSGANERISNSSNLVMAGGTLALNGFTETLNTLSLTANSTIDLGSGGRLLLSDSSGANWSTGMVLTIAGTFVSGNSLQFGNAGGLTGTQLSQIQISGFQNLALDSSGFLTGSAIPEPSTYALLAGCAGLGLVIYRRRRQKAQALAVTQKL